MFLTPIERGQIKKDVNDFLKSCETCEIHVNYKVPTNPSEDEVYGNVTADSWASRHICCRASQMIVKPYQNKILDWGIIGVGDCVFYIDKAIVLDDVDYKSCNVTIKGSTIQWIPVPLDIQSYQHYLGFRLGNDVLFQALACTLKQGA
jgi:hypothetical protein